MIKAMLRIMLPLLTVLALGCRSMPPQGAPPGAEAAEITPELPPARSGNVAAGDPPAPDPPQEASGQAPAGVTLPRPAAAEDGDLEELGVGLPLPAQAAAEDPLVLLNRLPPGMDKEMPWPPLEAYWRRDEPGRQDAPGASAAEEPKALAPPGPAAPAAAKPPAPAAPPAEPAFRSDPADPATPADPAPPPEPAFRSASGTPGTAATPAPRAIPAAGRMLLARRNDRVEVLLDDAGWIFLGFDPRDAGEGISFLSRESGGGRTSFIFRVHELGSYELGFQLQDSGDGSIRNETVIVEVLPEDEFEKRLADSRGAADLEADAPDYDRAEKLFERGELDLALVEFIKNYREGDVYANDRIAAIYMAGRNYEAALKYYRRNLDDAAPGARGYRDRAVLGAMRAGLGLEDPDLMLEFLDDFLGLRTLPIADELVGAAALQLNAGRHAGARLLLLEYRTRYPHGKRMDEVLFLLGRLYEQDSPLRDLEASRASYQRVYDEYPESLLADEAYERIRYLDRHFFHVQ